MSVESTAEVMQRYWGGGHSDTGTIADDAVFTIMDTGEEHHGPEGIGRMLKEFYHGTFEAGFETTNTMIADGKAVVEGYVVGKHTGEFAGIPATGKDIRVPLCVIYEVENNQITKGRVYMASGILFQQIGAR